MVDKNSYKICNRCIMDTSDPDITFDNEGNCNHCSKFEKEKDYRISKTYSEKELVEKYSFIKKRKRKYDCLIGVSGGVDSTYVAYFVKKVLGLNPLAVHFDNGWNSELANSNIEKLLEKLEIDLHTVVIDWPTFREIQLAFLHSHTPDGEIPTDHAITATMFQIASKYRIKYIFTGLNYSTESIMPNKWSYGHIDWRYIKTIIKKHTKSKIKLKRYPHFNFIDLLYFNIIKRIKVVAPLNYIDYDKEETINFLKTNFDWRPYGGKHYESIYTRYYQGEYLVRKFGIDKTRAHLSNLIMNGSITRKEALLKLMDNEYNPEQKKIDQEFVCKKLRISEEQLKQLIDAPPRYFTEYKNHYHIVSKFRTLVNYLRSKNILSK